MGFESYLPNRSFVMTERTTVIGVFDDRTQAQQAIRELRLAGFREDQIGMTARHDLPDSGDVVDGEESYAAEGGAAGLAAGAGLGVLWGLGVVAGVMPAVGPAIAAGTLAAILSSAAAGAAVAGVAGTLIGLGIPRDEAEYYESEFRAGRVIVSVRVDGRQSEAAAVMRRFGGHDMHSRVGSQTSATV